MAILLETRLCLAWSKNCGPSIEIYNNRDPVEFGVEKLSGLNGPNGSGIAYVVGSTPAAAMHFHP